MADNVPTALDFTMLDGSERIRVGRRMKDSSGNRTGHVKVWTTSLYDIIAFARKNSTTVKRIDVIDGVLTYTLTDGTVFELGSVAGKDGKDGAPGKDGVNGKDGIDGKDGSSGLAGNDGAPGPAGAAGKNGLDGRDGAPGAAGLDGKAGSNGLNGNDGIAGKDGSTGPTGPAGAPGLAGKDGAAGSNGPSGKDGAAGPAGPVGQDGAAGKDGSAGATGLPGVAGKDGAAGARGATGATGPSPLLILGTFDVSQTAVIAISAGVRTITVPVTGLLATDIPVASPVGPLPNGYSIGLCSVRAAGQLDVPVTAPLLSIGASYTIKVKVAVLR